MSHNIQQIRQQAEHLAKLRIADRAKYDLFFLCKEILGYDLMTERTHGDLCRFTKSLLPNNPNNIQEPTDKSTVAQWTMDDVRDNNDKSLPSNNELNSTPTSTPDEPRLTTLDDTDQPAGVYTKNPPHTYTKNIEQLKNQSHTTQKILDSTISSKSLEILQEGLISEIALPSDNIEQKSYSVTENTGLYNFNPPAEYAPNGYDPDKKALLIEMPRGTFKSSVVTVGFSIQFILNNPDGRVLIDSETYSKAKNFLTEIKGHFESNEVFRDVYKTIYGVYPDEFKKDSSVRWKDSEVDLSCRTKKKKEASFTASGVDKSINGMHYDLIICDDLHSEKNVTNLEQIEQVKDHWKLSLSLLDPNKFMVVIGTRWHHKDLYSYLLKKEKHRFNVYVRQAYNPDGSLLFPEVLDEKFLKAQRESQGNYIFSAQYMNNPTDDDTAIFRHSYLKEKEWGLVKDIPINWFLSVDPSWEGKDSDYAAFVVAGLDAQMNLYVRHVTRKKMTYGEIIDEIFRLYNIYKPKEIALETIAQAKSLQYMLANEQKRRQAWLPVREIVSRSKSKEERVRGLSPYYEFGRCIHIAEMSQKDEFEDELLNFPKAEHDDMVDALATILEIAKPPRSSLTPEEREDKKKKIDRFTKPRSPFTKV